MILVEDPQEILPLPMREHHLPFQAVVAAIIIAYHALYAGITYVLQLLIIRAIHISFIGI